MGCFGRRAVQLVVMSSCRCGFESEVAFRILGVLRVNAFRRVRAKRATFVRGSAYADAFERGSFVRALGSRRFYDGIEPRVRSVRARIVQQLVEGTFRDFLTFAELESSLVPLRGRRVPE